MEQKKQNFFRQFAMKAMYYINNLVPKTLLTRFMLIIIVPTVVGQIASIYLFYERHWYNVSEYSSASIARQIALMVDRYKENDQISLQSISNILKIEYDAYPNKKLNKVTILDVDQSKSEEIEILRRELDDVISLKKNVYLASSGKIIVNIETNEGVFQVQLPSKPILNPTTYIFVLWIVSLTILILIISLLFSKNQIKSIIELTSAANEFGNSKLPSDKTKYKPSGAKEIRLAGLAFIRMRERIERQITKRTQMLAMISHDLRTPLTRIKLQAALMNPQEGLKEIEQDVINMENIITSYLDFVRGEGGEKFQKVELSRWINDNIKYTKIGKLKINYDLATNCVTSIKHHALLRAMSNIISNSEKYASKIKISSYKEKGDIIITIEDNGPGISEKDKKMVFVPFFRSDSARAIDHRGSVGLGLTITREIILGHNGKIFLEDGKNLKGLLVKIVLPSE